MDIVQHLHISFNEYMQEAKIPIEEVTEALLVLLRKENTGKLWEVMASTDLANRDLVESLLPIYRTDPAGFESRLRDLNETARNAYLETATRKLLWRTRYLLINAVARSMPEELNRGLDTKHQLLQVSLSDEFLSRLPSAISRASLLSDWAMKEASSEAAEIYLAEACDCFLYGLDTACVVMCRSLLEEVLERKFSHHLALHVRRKRSSGPEWTLGSLLTVLKQKKSEWGIDDDLFEIFTSIKDAGNEATHEKTVTQEQSLSCLKNLHSALTKLL